MDGPNEGKSTNLHVHCVQAVFVLNKKNKKKRNYYFQMI